MKKHGKTLTLHTLINEEALLRGSAARAELLDLAQDLASTPTIMAEHYAYEMNIMTLDASFGSPLMGYTWAEFVSYYDEDTGETQQ